MLFQLPVEIQELIYKNLDGKSRCKVRTCLSKSIKVPFGSPTKEKQLTVAAHYIKRHKDALRKKTKTLPHTIHSVLLHEAKLLDSYSHDLLTDIGAYVDNADNQVNAFTYIIQHIKNNNLLPSKLQSILQTQTCFKDDKQINSFLQIVGQFASKDTITILLDNLVTQNVLLQSMKCKIKCENFIFYVVNYCNSQLLDFMFTTDERTSSLFNTRTMINYITSSKIAPIFSTCSIYSTKLFLQYFGCHLSHDVLQTMRDKSAESISYDFESALYIDQYINKQKNIECECKAITASEAEAP